MKIGNTPDKPANVAGQTSAAAASDASKVTVAVPDASATVALSSAASTLISGAGTPEFDTAKVQRISRAISEGKFTINAEAIADKLIANAHELLGKAQR
jgi:negative regulator of flagellin synthesis FlgM